MLAIALILGCTGWTPAVAQQTQTESVDQTGLSSVPADAGQALKSDILPQIGTQKEAELRHVARLRGEETLDTHVYLNNDGTKTLYCYDHPVQYLDEQGKMCDISLDIADTTDVKYPFRTKANSAVTFFPASLSDGVKLSGNGVELRLAAQLPLSTNKKQSVRRLDDQTVSYTYDANTTIEYTLTYTGFKEDIVVNTYTGQTEYSFVLYTNGLALTELDGSYYLTDGAGDIQASIGDVIVFTADERNNTFGQMRAETIEPKQQYSMTIVLDAEYLADPQTAYPIRIDPTVSLTYAESGADSIADVTIHSNYTSGGERTYLILGPWDVDDISRILMKFPGIDFSAYEGVTITSAIVSLRDLMCESTQLGMYCYPFTGSAWEEGTVSWENVTQSWGDLLDSHIISYYAEDGSVSSHRYEFEIKEAVQAWVDGDPTITPEKGIIFKASDEIENGTTLEYRTFGSFERDSYKPFFTMTYQSGITLSQSSASVYKGETIELTATTAPAGQAVTWTSDTPAVASVDENGVVTGLSTGNAIITAELEDETIAACTIEVLAKIIDFRYNTNTEVYKGNTVTLMPYTEPADEPVTWTSLDSDIASVTQEGVVTGVNVGIATIRAALSDGTYAECRVYVLSKQISLDYINITLYTGDTKTLVAETEPLGEDVDWESNDPNIARVSTDGLVTAVSAGETTICASIDNEICAVCAVTVKNRTISLNTNKIEIAVGESFQLEAETDPFTFMQNWGSLDTSIATVSPFGEVVGVAPGDTLISVSVPNGPMILCPVTVLPQQISITGGNSVREGYSINLTANMRPADWPVTWSSSDPSIATVNQNGKVTGVRAGVVTITATMEGGPSATYEVCVFLKFGMYQIKNIEDELFLAVRSNRIYDGTPAMEEIDHIEDADEDILSHLAQIWQVTHEGNGYYTIRPAHLLKFGLYVTESSLQTVSHINVGICNIELTEEQPTIPENALWKITYDNGGYIFESARYTGLYLMPEFGNGGRRVNMYCEDDIDEPSARWEFLSTTVEPQILLYDGAEKTKGKLFDKIDARPNQTVEFDKMGIIVSIVSNYWIYGADDIAGWDEDNPEVARVNTDGTVTTIKYGSAEITAWARVDDVVCYLSYTFIVSKFKLTGDELDYEPESWNDKSVQGGGTVTDHTNCYAYAINCQIDPVNKNFGCNFEDTETISAILQQPGDLYNHNNQDGLTISPLNESGVYSVATVSEAVQKDFEIFNTLCGGTSRFVDLKTEEIPVGAYRVYLAIAPGRPGSSGDYHWYRQNPDGTWSHKRGIGHVINTVSEEDATIIWDPEEAAEQIGYTTDGSYFAVIPWNKLYAPADTNQLNVQLWDTMENHVEKGDTEWTEDVDLDVPIGRTVFLIEYEGMRIESSTCIHLCRKRRAELS